MNVKKMLKFDIVIIKPFLLERGMSRKAFALILAFIFQAFFLYGSTWTNSTNSDFANGQFVSTEATSSGSTANIQLLATSTNQFGCQSLANTTNIFNLDATTKQYSIRF